MAESAQNKVGFEDIFKDDVFSPVIKAARELEKVLSDIEARFKELQKGLIEKAKGAEKSAAGMRQAGKAVAELAQTTKQLDALEKERVKLQEKLKALEDARAKEIAKLKFQIRDTQAEYKRLAQAETAAARAAQALQLINDRTKASYADLSNALNDLRERYKDLVVSGQENTEEAAKLRDAIAKLDAELKKIDYSVGQFQRNVGNYAVSFRQALEDFFRGAGPAGQAVLGLGFAAQRAGDAFKAAGGGVKGFFKAIAEGTKALRGVGLILLLELIQKLMSLGAGNKELEAARERLRQVRDEIELTERIAAVKLRIQALDEDSLSALRQRELLIQQQAQLELQLLQKQREAALKAKAEAEAAAKESEETILAKIARAFGKALGALLRGIGLMVGALGQLAQLVGGSGEAFTKFAASIRSAADAVEGFFANINASETAKEIDKIADAEQKLSEIAIREKEIQAELQKQREEIAKRRKELVEQALEALQVEVERERTQREALKEEYDKRIRELSEAYERAREVLAGESELLADAQRRYLEGLLALEAERARKEGEIIAEQTQKVVQIRERIQQTALEAEIAAIRARYDALIGEIEQAERELGTEETELKQRLEEEKTRAIVAAQLRASDEDIKLRQRLSELRLETERSAFATEEEFQKYRERRLLEIQIEAARERLSTLKELYRITGDKQVELEIAIVEATIAQAEAKLKALAKASLDTQKQIIQEYLKAVEALADAFSQYMQRLDEKALSSLQRRQDALSRRIAVFEGLARQGALAASESIAALEAQEAELVRKQEEVKRKAQRREFAIAAVKTYVQLLERNEANALAKTIRDITLLTQLIARLPTFYEGSEFVSEGIRIPHAARDALIVRVHDGERIVPADINRQLGGVRNEDLPKLVRGGGEISFDVDSFYQSLDTIIRKHNTVKRYKRIL